MLSDISGQQCLKSFPLQTKEGVGKYVNSEDRLHRILKVEMRQVKLRWPKDKAG